MHLTSRIRLLLVDDHPVMRAGLANLLSTEPDFQVVAQADDGETAIRLWQQHTPDVCLLDMTMHGLDGVETLKRLHAIAPQARALMLTSSDSAEDVARALAAGANGYITKSVRHSEVFAAIRSVHAGGRPVSEHAIVDSRPTRQVAGISLTPREIEVVAFMREGFTNAEIGRLLGISTHTAKAHVAGVIDKLGANDRTQAVARAFDLGLLSARSPKAATR
jgi:DNA-binding NarL/FixJ family response regulator